jgi:hypothetical protein
MNADVAQWVACSPETEKVAGSNPSLDKAFYLFFYVKSYALITRLVINAAMGNVHYEPRNQRCHGQRGLQATMGDVLNNVLKCP